MKTFVALMRGVNVGGARKLPMAELRALCPSLGLERPQTYLQSGNLLFDAEGEADDLRLLLEENLTARFGFSAAVVLRAAADWKHYVHANPFADDGAALANMVHLYLCRDPMKADGAEELRRRARVGERIRLGAGALWIDYGARGVHASKLTPAAIDKACGSPTTGRNWRTVLAIADMIGARK